MGLPFLLFWPFRGQLLGPPPQVAKNGPFAKPKGFCWQHPPPPAGGWAFILGLSCHFGCLGLLVPVRLARGTPPTCERLSRPFGTTPVPGTASPFPADGKMLPRCPTPRPPSCTGRGCCVGPPPTDDVLAVGLEPNPKRKQGNTNERYTVRHHGPPHKGLVREEIAEVTCQEKPNAQFPPNMLLQLGCAAHATSVLFCWICVAASSVARTSPLTLYSSCLALLSWHIDAALTWLACNNDYTHIGIGYRLLVLVQQMFLLLPM